MANTRKTPRPGEISETPSLDEMKKLEQMLSEHKQKINALELEKTKRLREKQEDTLADYALVLAKQGIELTEKIKKDFLKKFEKERQEVERKAALEYYKEFSARGQKEAAQKEKQLKREEEIAKLRYEATQERAEGNWIDAFGKSLSADLKENFSMMGKGLSDMGKKLFQGIVNIGDKLSGEINSTISTYSKYQSEMNARLQGTETTFQKLESNLTQAIGMTPYVRTSAMLETLNELVGQGIAFNLEQRAFLESISDKVATTFDVAEASLLRIVRLQQTDSSASRLGMEAYLTQFLNQYFMNTEYMTSSFDTVTNALLEATSQLGTQQAVEFEYIVQKWLGSLTAVGMSESTISSLATALGYLGSGNVSALSGSEMQNLLVMAASRAGLDYSSILTQGLNAYNTNSLLQAVVGYMQEIGGSESRVVKSQYAKVFGVSVSDLIAASNLSNELNYISGNLLSYEGSLQELGDQLNKVSSRTSIAEQIQNMLANIKFGIGQGIAQSTAMAGIWSITDLIQGVTGGIAIPTISVMGNYVDLNTTVENLMKTGLVGVSTLGKIGDLVTGLSNASDMSRLMGRVGDSWSGLGLLQEMILRTEGSGLGARGGGMSTSLTTSLSTSSGSDIYEATLAGARKETSRTVEAQRDAMQEKTADDIYKYLIETFDPKLDVALQRLTTIASAYGVASATGMTADMTVDMLSISQANSVVISPPADDGFAQTQLTYLSEISSNTANILQLLQNGTVKVSIENYGLTFGGEF